MKSKPLVSFVITSWNRYDDIVETINQINTTENGYVYEVIIIDNASTDKRYTNLAKLDNVIYRPLPKNIGCWEGRNVAMRIAKGEFIVSLDDDSFPGQECIDRALQEFKIDTKLGIIAMNVIDYKQMETFVHPRFDYQGTDSSAFIGCGAIFRRNLLDKVGMWEPWFAGAIEHSFSIRVMNAGYDIRLFDDIYVFHKLTPKSRPVVEQTAHHACNIFKMYWTYYPWARAMVLSFKMLRRGLTADILSGGKIYSPGFLATIKDGKPKRYVIKPRILNSTRIPLRLEGLHITTPTHNFKPANKVLLLRTRPVQTVSNYVRQIHNWNLASKITLLSHKTVTNIEAENLHDIEWFVDDDHFSYKGLTRAQRKKFKEYDLLLFMAEDKKILGGVENIQMMALRLGLPLGSVGLSGTFLHYDIIDLLFVKIYEVFGTLLAVVLMLRALLTFKRQKEYEFETYVSS